MPLDCYKVEVLYLLNPHLIWVEVRDAAITSMDEHGIKFEQIGISGLLPLETTINIDDERLKIQGCNDWTPASTTVMRKFCAEEEDIMFVPEIVDQRSSIFDDNIHKFGDLFVKRKHGKPKYLSELLSQSGFATYDTKLFQLYFSEGKINTKLSRLETQNVLTEIEKYFINKNLPKKKLEKHTSVARAASELEEALTKTNLDKHNKHMKAILESKNRDLELCKGVDELSVGRATTRKGKEKKILTPVEKKLELLQIYKTKADSKVSRSQESNNGDHSQAFEDTKMYLESIASRCSKKISSKTDAHKAQILKKVMSKTAIKKGSKQEKITNRLLAESKERKDKRHHTPEIEVNIPVNQTINSCSSSTPNSISGSEPDELSKPEETKQFVEIGENTSSSIITQDQQVLVKEDHNNCHISSVSEIERSDKDDNNPTIKFVQEQPVKPQNTEAVSLHEENTKNTLNDSCNEVLPRRSSKVKPSKKGGKVEVNTATIEPQESLPETNSEAHSSVPNNSRLAYPPQNVNCDQETQNSRRVPELPKDGKASTPVSEEIVKKLMTSFKLTGSRHSDMIQNAIRKCKDGATNNAEAITALMECQNKIMHEIKELDNVAKIDIEQTSTRTVVKTNPKRRGKNKHNVVTTTTKTIFGPPGIDLEAISRVPPVFLYGNPYSRNNGQNNDVTPIRIDSFRKDGSIVTSDADKSDRSNASCEVNENVTTPDREIIKHKNEKKVTPSPNSSVWERRLKLHKEIAKNKRCATQTLDETQKDSSNVGEKSPPKNLIEQETEDDSDESISTATSKLSLGNSVNLQQAPNNKEDNYLVRTLQNVGSKSNPFLNFDINNSVFVDNLVTPLIMVHSKMNKRFEPISNYRDIHFSEHIRLVLKNIRIERPMAIQSITWNAILRGHSVIAIGHPCCGKSMGYIPAVCQLITDFNQSESYSDSVGPICIIVCAMSKSVSDIEQLTKMLVGCNEKIVSCYYGHDELAIATSLLNGCDLLICTAPSLVRLLQMPQFGLDLQRLATFVLDDCERLSEEYSTELKFCLRKIKDMQKLRVNKELSVQYIVASRMWCDFMEPFANKAPDTMICIGAFHECVLYAKANMTVRYVQKDNKLQYLLDFLEDVDPSKKTVIVCDSDEEVEYLSKALAIPKYFVFACSNKMTLLDLFNLRMLLKDFKEPLMAPVLICRDDNLYHINVTDAHYLVQYSLPPLFSSFSRRFSALNDSYSSQFRTSNEVPKILVLLEEKNVEQFPKMIHFVKRCTDNIPKFVDDICMTALADKDAKKAENFKPLCEFLLTLGECPDLYNCHYRHTIFKDYDQPKEWLPKSGIVTFKILHYRSAALYSAVLVAHLDGREPIKYANEHSIISLKVGTHYANKKNRILLGVPKLGDICAYAQRNDLFYRCQVIKIIDRYERGNPRNVLIRLIDEELIEIASDTNLYYLPDDLQPGSLRPCVVNVRLANIQPRDKDIVFSELAREYVIKEGSSVEKGIYMKGNIVLTLGNCLYVETLEICQDLKSLNETVVIHDVIRGLLEKHAEVNPDHINKIKELCKKANFEIKSTENNEHLKSEPLPAVTATSKVRWAHLDEDMSIVDFGVVENPDILFVRLTKFDECMKILIRNIQTYVTDNTAKIEELIKDDIVLAEYPDDGLYERARIDEIENEKVKCFFVDQGEWRHLNKDKLLPISEALITQLPFQTIECRLVGVKPLGDQWTDFACNWLFDKCAESVNCTTKQLFVQYFTKEPARFTGGHKYGVVVVDTYGSTDLILNQAMIDLNLAKEIEDEMRFVEMVKRKNEQELKSNVVEEDDTSFEELSRYSPNSDSLQNVVHSSLMPRPIRSIPLVGSDDESDDTEKWNVNMTADMAEMFRPLIPDQTEGNDSSLLAIESNDPGLIEEIDTHSPTTNQEESSNQIQPDTINPDLSKDLDSDDLSAPESCQSETKTLEKVEVPLCEFQLRKPKISWKQTKTTVIFKIQLIGVEEYDLNIQDRALSFTTTVNDTDYGFDIELYGVIDKKSAFHSNKGQYILVKLNKIKRNNWLSLTKDVGTRKWIVYDVDSIDVSSEEEEMQKDDFYNIMKNMHRNGESESDDDFIDDVGYGQKYDD